MNPEGGASSARLGPAVAGAPERPGGGEVVLHSDGHLLGVPVRLSVLLREDNAAEAHALEDVAPRGGPGSGRPPRRPPRPRRPRRGVTPPRWMPVVPTGSPPRPVAPRPGCRAGRAQRRPEQLRGRACAPQGRARPRSSGRGCCSPRTLRPAPRRASGAPAAAARASGRSSSAAAAAAAAAARPRDRAALSRALARPSPPVDCGAAPPHP